MSTPSSEAGIDVRDLEAIDPAQPGTLSGADVARINRLIAEVKRLEGIADDPDNVYCATCGACGIEGCCRPHRCKFFKGYQGEYDTLVAEWHDRGEEIKRLKAELTVAHKEADLWRRLDLVNSEIDFDEDNDDRLDEEQVELLEDECNTVSAELVAVRAERDEMRAAKPTVISLPSRQTNPQKDKAHEPASRRY